MRRASARSSTTTNWPVAALAAGIAAALAFDDGGYFAPAWGWSALALFWVAGLALFLRDRFSCQYCGDPRELTFDHVLPRAQGGRTTWDNVATACAPCNLKKGGRTPQQAHMQIRRRPFRPTSWQLQEHGRSFPPNYLHESWRDYLYWDVELEA